jgi:hypothetical protein
MKPSDACYVPMGTLHECWNITGEPVVVMFGVAPKYLP